MSRRIAVAAPPAEPWDDLFAVIDRMTGPQLRAFLVKFAKRFNLPTPPSPESPA